MQLGGSGSRGRSPAAPPLPLVWPRSLPLHAMSTVLLVRVGCLQLGASQPPQPPPLHCCWPCRVSRPSLPSPGTYSLCTGRSSAACTGTPNFCRQEPTLWRGPRLLIASLWSWDSAGCHICSSTSRDRVTVLRASSTELLTTRLMASTSTRGLASSTTRVRKFGFCPRAQSLRWRRASTPCKSRPRRCVSWNTSRRTHWRCTKSGTERASTFSSSSNSTWWARTSTVERTSRTVQSRLRWMPDHPVSTIPTFRCSVRPGGATPPLVRSSLWCAL
mmetsp:Transcript_17818/g.46530  ORF Transcript_17818/g.46530 Transcript_17818/m.46530 type:complete len:274 (+) Transcript_17818:1138-1959(+)